MTNDSMDLKLKTLNSVSPSFCLAKWLQVTVDLVNGTTHSCHHPKRHTIPLEELSKDVSALHNTQFKKEQRQKMLSGERPSECNYCWEMEDVGTLYSDRFIKSTDPLFWTELTRIQSLPWDSPVNPLYLEVMLDKTCNFSCAYCMADISSSVAAEMEHFGKYPGLESYHRLKGFSAPEGKTAQQVNELYADAFKAWLPQIISGLKVLRVTGGEPLLSPRFWELLDQILLFETKSLTFAVNSHLSHQERVMERFVSKMREVFAQNKITHLEVFTSIDAFGSHAEYIRNGMNYERVIHNIISLKKAIPATKIVITCTFNLLSIGNFKEFLMAVVALKKQVDVNLDIAYLKNPLYLRADMADGELLAMAVDALEYMKSRSEYFVDHELKKFENIIQWMSSSKVQSEVDANRADFYLFISEYDRRKSRDFLAIFPEYLRFFYKCRMTLIESILLKIEEKEPNFKNRNAAIQLQSVPVYTSQRGMLGPLSPSITIDSDDVLLSDDFSSLILNHGNENLNLKIRSSMAFSPDEVKRLGSRLFKCVSENKIKDIDVLVQLESTEVGYKHSIVDGNYLNILNNLIQLKSDLPSIKFVLYFPVHILSIGKLKKLLKSLISLGKRSQIQLELSRLDKPEYLSTRIADEAMKKDLLEAYNYMREHRNFFSHEELTQLSEIVQWTTGREDNILSRQMRAAFFLFICRHDLEKKTRFQNIFPEYSAFFKACGLCFMDLNLR